MRRAVQATVVCVALVAGSGSPAAAGPPVTSAAERQVAVATLPTVNMAAVAAAAEAESLYGNKPGLGDDPSTRLVQQALRAKGYATAADGWYGPGTRRAYSAYQRSLGYTGLAANGLPGPTSLTKLGAGRFTVAHPVTLGSTRDSYGGKRVNTRTKRMLAAADSSLSWNLTLSQGSYNPGGDPDSAGTHDGGGAVGRWTSASVR